jgi:beta-glucosidase-like glycosyl hydrolase
MKVLKKEELTIEQKLGMTMCATIAHGEADTEYVLDKIRNHACGAVWVSPRADGSHQAIIERVLAAADYPIVIVCDSESGAAPHTIPQQIAITAAGAKDEDAYAFGYVTAALRRREGYNMICNPVVDVCHGNTPCGHTTRTYGSDIDTVTRLGIAAARGMHAGGILACAKHYPGGSAGLPYDTHMREDVAPYTEEEMLATHLRPYLALLDEGLLDGIMPGHRRFPNIDPAYPACLSRKVLDMMRKRGFNGIYISDALCMMGVVLKYGPEDPVGIAVAAGCDLPLPWEVPFEPAYKAMLSCYERGIVTEAQVDECLERILATQEKIAALPAPCEEIDPAYTDRIAAMHTASVYSIVEEGLSPSISRDGRHYFIIATDGSTKLSPEDYLPGPREWMHPPKIVEMLKRLFPNSEAVAIGQYPSVSEVMRSFTKQVPFDDVVFITYGVTSAYIGPEHLTSRLVAFMDSLQTTDRIAAHLYFGNPYVLGDAPYVKRIIAGFASMKSVEYALEVLAGNATAEGAIPYDDVVLHKRGDIIY